MRIAYSSCTASSRGLHAFFQRFLLCYLIGMFMGLLAIRTSLISMGDTMTTLGTGVSLAGKEASAALFRSGCFLFLTTVLVSQLSGRAFFLMLLVVGKAFTTAYVFGALFAMREVTGFAWIRLLAYTVLVLPIFYSLVLHGLAPRMRYSGKLWIYRRFLPVLWMIGLLAAAVWLSAALCALI